jgi:TatD DNase family protein
MIDTHTHLNFKAFSADWPQVVEASIAKGVERMIVVGTDAETSKKAVEIAQSHEALFAAVGVHPHHAKAAADAQAIDELVDEITHLAAHPKVIAIGEIGIDHHEYKHSKYAISDIDIAKYNALQNALFRKQLLLAARLKKPVIVHSRSAKDEALQIIEEVIASTQTKLSGVFHCFEGSKKMVKRVIAMGFYISFTANITYIPDRLDVASLVPLDRLLLETDCPYMSPASLRGERNTPSSVTMIAAAHAASRAIDITQIEMQTDHNARLLFQLDKAS